GSADAAAPVAAGAVPPADAGGPGSGVSPPEEPPQAAAVARHRPSIPAAADVLIRTDDRFRTDVLNRTGVRIRTRHVTLWKSDVCMRTLPVRSRTRRALRTFSTRHSARARGNIRPPVGRANTAAPRHGHAATQTAVTEERAAQSRSPPRVRA